MMSDSGKEWPSERTPRRVCERCGEQGLGCDQFGCWMNDPKSTNPPRPLAQSAKAGEESNGN